MSFTENGRNFVRSLKEPLMSPLETALLRSTDTYTMFIRACDNQIRFV